ncbi:hypothetical protein R5R35_010313 [Gryllus longicercus]|uniref:Coiled-coil domain-containing protein 22 homolog n=1 Tax=Gryllus longicercus TaxID=2509291 RepID=A0AAN9V3Y3_9ORTH
MEEVDNIIIHSLRKIGCDIEDEIDSLKLFSPELVVQAAVKCLDIIQPQLGLPHSLPPSMSARFRLGASLAQACVDLGYPGEMGYQTFLYSNEADVRRVFMFLIEKLPKEAEKSIIEPAGRTEILVKQIGEVLKKQLQSPWLPSYCWRRGVRWREDGSWSREGCGHHQPFSSCDLNIPKTVNLKNDVSQAWCEYYVRYLPLVTDQVANRRQLVPSLINFNEKSIALKERLSLSVPSESICIKIPQRLLTCLVQDVEKSSQLDFSQQLMYVNDSGEKSKLNQSALSDKFQNSQVTTAVQNLDDIRTDPTSVALMKQKQEEEQLEKTREEVENFVEVTKETLLSVKKLSAKLAQLNEDLPGEEKALKELEERYAVKKRTYDLLPDAEANLSKLQSMVESSAQKLVSLAAQWEKHRAPLLEQYRGAKERNSNKASESQKQADAVRALKEKARELSDEIRCKEQLHSQLVAEYESISKDTKRSAYTRRIMEIIGNIRKQKEEIDKVINDTRELQKEINNLTGRLDRSFTDADERIFRDAKKDEVARRAYKLLATLHSDCSELVQMVEETGATVREIRDLEEQIEIESAKNVGANLERVSADLKQMKQENAALTAQLKSKLQSNNVKTV